jgi:hypothetical protein
MPRFTERHILARGLRHRTILLVSRLKWELRRPKEQARLQEELNATARKLGFVLSTRYLRPRLSQHAKTRVWREFLFRRMPEQFFRQQVRMSRGAFDLVLEKIRGDPVFLNNSHRKQTDVRIQLALALNRLGTTGNGTSVLAMASKFGVAVGTVDNFTRRVITALVNLKGRYLRFPDVDERREISQRIGLKYGFDGCVGFVDGTPINFVQRPGVDGGTYFNRKSRYAMNAQVVCDDRRVIRYVYTGWPGSVHDSRAWKASAVWNRPGIFFSRKQYLMADTAYALSKWCLKPYTEPAASIPRNARFNYLFAKARVVNEHTIGILKNRWASLKGLPHQIQKTAELKSVSNWILACVVLHNMLMSFGDEWRDDHIDGRDDEDEAMGNAPRQAANQYGADGVLFRDELQSNILRGDGFE